MLINQDFSVDRSKYIGGSDIGAILGLSRFRSPLEVWMEKTGKQAKKLDSIPLSFGVGYGLCWYMAHELQSNLYRVPVHLPAAAYAYSALVTVVSALLSSLAVRWRIRQLDLIAVLKTRE